MLEVTPIQAFRDNYIWAFRAAGAERVCIVDPGDADPVLDWLDREGLGLEAILLTHHHADHIGGVDALLARERVTVYGPDTARIPQVTNTVAEGDTVEVAGVRFDVLEVPGHTLEHIAYFTREPVADEHPLLFCGDTLFAAGCGRMFEGTPPMMQASLQKLAGLHPDTLVFCAHEYTLANLDFAAAAMPHNEDVQERMRRDAARRREDKPTVPSTLATELRTNPFLRCEEREIHETLGERGEKDLDDPARVFGILRRWKDEF